MPIIAEQDSIRPRPVWARYLRRQAGRPVAAPTDDEKHDAILVLGLSETELAVLPMLHVEAQRIMDWS